MLMDLKGRVTGLFKNYKLKNSVVRIINAWLSVCIIEMLHFDCSFADFSYLNGISAVLHIVFIAEIYIFYELLNNLKADRILLMALSFLYILEAATVEKDVYFSIAAFAIMSGVIAYAYSDKLRIRVKHSPVIACFIAMGVFFTVFTCVISIDAYLNRRIEAHDFGVYVQMFENMRKTGLPITTCERDTLFNHFAISFSPILYTILPIYAVIPNQITLLVIPGILVASGLIPLYFICRQHRLSDEAAILFGVCYTFMPIMSGGCFSYIHEGHFIPSLLLWFIYCLESDKKYIQTAIVFILLVCVKEDAAIYAAALSLYFVFSGKNVKKGLIFFASSAVAFTAMILFMRKLNNGSFVSEHYTNYMFNGENSLSNVIAAVLVDPVYAVRESFEADKFKFMIQMMLPLCFLPFMLKKPSKLVLLAPLLFMNMMPDYKSQYSIADPYAYGTAVTLIYISILNYNDLKHRRTAKKILLIAACCSVILMTQSWYHKVDLLKEFKSNEYQRLSFSQAEQLIPDDAVVAASDKLFPAVANRKTAYIAEMTDNEAEYIYLDLRNSADDMQEAAKYLNGKYSVVYYQYNVAGVLKNESFMPGN